MSYSLSPTNRSEIVTPASRFTVAVEGDFRGGQLHVLFSVNGQYASGTPEAIYIFDASDIRTFDANGEDVKLLWIGDTGAVEVTLTEAPATPVADPSAAALAALISEGRLKIEMLGLPIEAHQLPAGALTANTALTNNGFRCTMRARGCDIRYEVTSGVGAVASSTTSHFIAENERLDILLPVDANIAVVRNSTATVSGTLELSILN